jgi:hypothetical protein
VILREKDGLAQILEWRFGHALVEAALVTYRPKQCELLTKKNQFCQILTKKNNQIVILRSAEDIRPAFAVGLYIE